MAQEETFCADNFIIPSGPRGPRGEQGKVGPTGPGGGVTRGPQGPPGGSKIDINFQTGSEPFSEIRTANNYQTLAHFIFPGTAVFTPKTWRVAIGTLVTTGANKLTIRLAYLKPDGTKVIVAQVDKKVVASTQGFTYEIVEVSSFTDLPSTASNFLVEVLVNNYDPIKYRTRLYATELRE